MRPQPPKSAPWLRVTLLASMTALLAVSASARPYHRREPVAKQPAEELAPPKGPLFFVISTGKQHVTVYSPDGFYVRSPVSTGRPDHPTPLGLFTILGKERYHHSNIYSGAPMPFMQRVTYSGVAMHEGVLPGFAASHGCIRMPHEFAKRMFSLTAGNERVVITRQDVVPVSFAHPRLPVPSLVALPPAPENLASGSEQMLRNALAATDVARRTVASERVDVSVKANAPENKPEDAGQRLLNPLDFAKAMKARAAKQAEEAAAAVNPARNAVEIKTREAKIAAFELKKAEMAFAMAKDRFDYLDKQLQRVSGEQAVTAATEARNAAEAKFHDAEAALEAARQVKANKDEELAAAMRGFKELENARKVAAEGVKSWNRRLSPLSVFISRQTQRLYVRQGNVKVFDVPITIRDPEKPLGTHLFMAMQPVQGTDGSPGMRWLALTMPEAAIGESESTRGRNRRGGRDDVAEAPRTPSTASAAAALDRIEMSPEVAEKISQMLWAGGSLIVSDGGFSREMNDYTDFIILTR